MPELGDISPQAAIAMSACMLLLSFGGVLILIALFLRAKRNPPSVTLMQAHLREQPWSLYDCSFVLFALLFCWSITSAAVSGLGHFGFSLPAEISPTTIFLSTFVFHVPAAVAILALAAYKHISLRQLLGTDREPAGRLLTKGIVFCIAALPVMWMVIEANNRVLSELGFELEEQTVVKILAGAGGGSWSIRVLLIFLAVIFIPVSEELLFRGLLLPAASKKLGLVLGTIVTSIIFGLLHKNIPSALPLFLLSCILCVVSAHTRSILVPIAMHATFNLVHIALITIMTIG